MYQIAQNFTVRTALSFTVCASLLLLPSVSLLSEASSQAVRNVHSGRKRPEGTLPDLEDVKKESRLEREALPPIPSTVRAKRNEGKPWDGRRVGDPGTSHRPLDQPEIRRAHARRRLVPPPLYEDQFIQNFFSLALLRSPNPDETLYWNNLLRADTSVTGTVNIRPIGAVVQTGVGCLKRVEQFRIPKAENLQHAQFLDAAIGWVSNNRSLFATTDGGRTWQQSNLNIPDDSRISSFSFLSPQIGWVSVVREIRNEENRVSYTSRLIVSTDAGKSWTERDGFNENVEVNVIRFLNPKTGFAAGLRVVQAKVPYPGMFLTRTDDGGSTWRDVSAEAKTAINEVSGGSNDYVADIVFTSSGNVNVLTAFGRTITSSDAGRSWKQLKQFRDERPQTSYEKLFLYDETMVVLSGTISREGTWGDLILEDRGAAWTTYEINNLALFDLEFLSPDAIVAAGGAFNGYSRSGSQYNGRLLPGVILRSNDRGKNWLEIYRSKANQPIIDLIKVGPTQLYAIGNEGTLLRLEMQTCDPANSVADMR
jgi:photosystem II stability/assembly factor-like uncharacterized protein